MLTMSWSFPVSVAVSGKLPVHLCHCSQEWQQLQAWRSAWSQLHSGTLPHNFSQL